MNEKTHACTRKLDPPLARKTTAKLSSTMGMSVMIQAGTGPHAVAMNQVMLLCLSDVTVQVPNKLLEPRNTGFRCQALNLDVM